MNNLKLLPVKGHKVFYRIIRAGWRNKCGPVIASVCFNNAFVFNELSEKNRIQKQRSPVQVVFYGVSAGKKVSKLAVVRNRIKRLLRESVRQAVAETGGAGCIEVIAVSWISRIARPNDINLGDVKPLIERIVQDSIVHYNEIKKQK